MLFIIFFMSIASVSALEDIQPLLNDQIINGIEADPDTFSWVVRLVIRHPSGIVGRCTSSVIQTDPYVLLTAAHCVDDLLKSGNSWTYKGEEVQVNIESPAIGGEVDADTDTNYVLTLDESSQIILHHSYTKHLWWESDIAVIITSSLDEGTGSGILIQPPILPDYSTQECCTSNKGDFIVLGYGITSTYSDATSDVLQETTMKYVSNAACQAAMPHDEITLAPNIMCMQGSETGWCKGDSGGPVYQNGVLYGVMSWNVDRCDLNYPEGAISVAYFRDWIDQAISAYESESKSELMSVHSETMNLMSAQNGAKNMWYMLALAMVVVVLMWLVSGACSSVQKKYNTYQQIADTSMARV